MKAVSDFELGERVKDADGYRASVRYIGPVAASKKADEIWLGVEWDKKDRGKHDGSCVDKEGNLHRYFECSMGAGSFVKGNKVTGGISFVQALQERYVQKDAPSLTKENDPTLPDAFVTTSKGNAKPIEFLGEHKLRKWQQIGSIDKVAIRDDKISCIGEGLTEIGGHFVEVDLQDNLLYKWSEIEQLSMDIRGLKTLLLHGNKMQTLSPEITGGFSAGSFHGLRTLALNACNILSWAEVTLLEPHVKNLEELYLSSNSLTDLPRTKAAHEAAQACGGVFTETVAGADGSDVAGEEVWTKLRVLDISNCGLDEWSQVAYFRFLPSLAELVLDANSLLSVQPRGSTSSFQALQRISISSTGLSSWSDVDAIASYDSVSNLRMSHVPLFKGMGASQVRPIVISRIKNLGFFNGSLVGKRERLDGEKGYLRNVLHDIDQAQKTGRPLSKEALHSLHPRYAELNDLHGADLLPMGNMSTGANLASELLSVTFINLSFSSGGSLDPVTKKVPSSITIQNMKGMVKQLFGLDPAIQQLSLTHKEYQDAPPVFMDDDQAPLAYYGAVNGADIFINEAKSEDIK